jgi:formiminotetrahydrofolate cyclodeaminase
MANPQLTSDVSIRELLRVVSSADSAPGAVAAAGAAAALGTALLLKVAALPTTRSESLDDYTRLSVAATGLSQLQEQLLETIETESEVKLFAARHLPQTTHVQQAKREAAIQLALRAAADVPLEVIRLCSRALQHSQTIASLSSHAVATEVELAVALLRAALSGARSNLEGRLGSLTDVVHAKAVVDQIASLSDEAAVAADTATFSIQRPPA